jgi:hypothetical protein
LSIIKYQKKKSWLRLAKLAEEISTAYCVPRLEHLSVAVTAVWRAITESRPPSPLTSHEKSFTAAFSIPYLRQNQKSNCVNDRRIPQLFASTELASNQANNKLRKFFCRHPLCGDRRRQDTPAFNYPPGPPVREIVNPMMGPSRALILDLNCQGPVWMGGAPPDDEGRCATKRKLAFMHRGRLPCYTANLIIFN